MIEFEGFGLENTEQNIINKELGTQPHILKQFMKALGAKEGSTSTKRYEWQTADQKDLWKDTLDDYKNLEYKGPGDYSEGKKADELAGFKATSFEQLKKLKDEGRLSLEGLNKLRNYGATAATQVNPDIEALRGLGDESNISFDRRLAETTRKAREKLQQSDIASRRGEGGTGGTALTRAVGQNIGDYGRTVGDAHARAVEEADYRNRQLAMQSRMQAGQLGLGATQQGLQGLSLAQSGELGQLQMTAQDLAQRRSIHSGERQYMAQNELQRARYSHDQAQARNLWNQTNASNQNQWNLSRLRDQTTAATTRTFEDVVTKKKGSAGLGGAVLTAGGAIIGGIYGGPAGASMGAQLGGSLAASSGDWGDDSMSGAIQQGAGMYSAYNQGGFNKTGGNNIPPSMRGMGDRPMASGDYSWWQDDPNSGWWDEMGRSNQQLGMDRQEALYNQQRWDRRFANRQNFLGRQNQLHRNFRMLQPQTHPYMNL